MKIITYLGITLLSILIQFTVMDYINENMQLDGNLENVFDLNITSHKKQLDDIMNKNLAQKRDAFYYPTHAKYVKKRATTSPSNKSFINSTLPDISLEISTDFSTTVVDELYDYNVTTTDVVYTSTEIGNETEITLFHENNNTTTIPKLPKRNIYMDCRCNLLYKVCDINCCCDTDCSDSDIKMFLVCNDNTNINTKVGESGYSCSSSPSNMFTQSGTTIANLFCVIKTNLPVKRNINIQKYDAAAVDRYYQWHRDVKRRHVNVFKRQPYNYGDPLWVLKDGTIRYMDLPSSVVNSYCTSRRPLRFLRDETITCMASLKDLEMFHILKASEDVRLVSVVKNLSDTSTLNCSNLHCVNWTIITCNDAQCVPYNKTLHEPSCSDSYCRNIASHFDYIFYYYESKITNATIRLYIQEISTAIPFLLQKIDIRFLIANETIDNIVKVSGNPGYMAGLPIIASFTESNHTYNFFNKTSTNKNYLSYPVNKNGKCILSNVTNNLVTFQYNKRMKCRYQHVGNISSYSRTETCKTLQENIIKLLGLQHNIVISPYGNSYNIKDDDWISMQKNIPDKGLVYGEYNAQHLRLHCYNIITGISLIFTYADISDKEGAKLLAAKLDTNVRNISFNVDITDISVILTMDIIFLDQTKPSIYEYAAGPQLNIHLPGDFFFPFPSNGCQNHNCYHILPLIMMVYCYRHFTK
ncbi:tectonic-1 [Galleria mellonella]|uniref:Tectonic-1 n=1 Tax=Galleria mellonella TaxID=7137 RepID=A0A6J3BV07_GALME|nr:tectonic-1 [Galleria mellonella]XP_031763610.2 tectonic-1 [Galleria mellonella]XP_052755535.1 tectonic-1 [Galleria mellonella]